MTTKHTKAEVDYGKGHGRIRCYLCRHYRPESSSAGTCAIVEGRIKAEDACDLFVRAKA